MSYKVRTKFSSKAVKKGRRLDKVHALGLSRAAKTVGKFAHGVAQDIFGPSAADIMRSSADAIPSQLRELKDEISIKLKANKTIPYTQLKNQYLNMHGQMRFMKTVRGAKVPILEQYVPALNLHDTLARSVGSRVATSHTIKAVKSAETYKTARRVSTRVNAGLKHLGHAAIAKGGYDVYLDPSFHFNLGGKSHSMGKLTAAAGAGLAATTLGYGYHYYKKATNPTEKDHRPHHPFEDIPEDSFARKMLERGRNTWREVVGLRPQHGDKELPKTISGQRTLKAMQLKQSAGYKLKR